AHCGAAITALDGAGDRPVRAELDPVEHEPDGRDDEVARHGQVRREEDGQSNGEQNEIEVAQDVGHAGRAGDAAGSVYGERGQLGSPSDLWMSNERMNSLPPTRQERRSKTPTAASPSGPPWRGGES